MLSSLKKKWELHLIAASVVSVSIIFVYGFTRFSSFKHKFVALLKQEPFQPHEIITARDASYILYGNGETDTNTDKSLHKCIRSMTSKQTPGERRLAGKPEQLHYSQFGQSQYVDKLLKGRHNGVFLECGASDGVTLSNSLFFEIHRNWTGILIEANPERLKSLIKTNRNAFVVRACLSVTEKPYLARYTMPNNVGGAVSSSLTEYEIKIFKSYSKSRVLPEIYVQCFPLTSILDALNIHHIDYLSLDVEGSEIEILRTVNWRKLTVDVLTIEYNRHLDRLRKLRTLFNKTGVYKEAQILPLGSNEKSGIDVVFTHR